MKKIFLAVIATAISFSLFAQLKIESNNIVDIGYPFGYTPLSTRQVQLQILGPGGTYNAGGKICFGDLNSYNSNVTVSEYGSTDTDQLQLTGKYGMFFTTGAQGTYVAMKIENDNVYVTNQLWVNGLQVSSDKRLKMNIQPLADASGLFKLKPVTYQYKPNPQNASAVAEVDEKGNKPLKEGKASKDKIGFLAQEVQEVYPQLVHEDANGMLSVDYVSMIPLLVETVKSQEAKIKALELELNKLKVATETKK